jgi:hypothetical protein
LPFIETCGHCANFFALYIVDHAFCWIDFNDFGAGTYLKNVFVLRNIKKLKNKQK